MNYQFRPVEIWPGNKTPEHERRSRYTFKAKWSSTLDLLERELVYLGAENLVIQCYPKNGMSDIRLDGMMRANAQIVESGVILSFDSKHGPLSYPCDSCELWQHNIRSIALALEALRSVDRYGVTKRAEQYKGWEKLPAPGAVHEFPSEIEAMMFLSDLLGESISNEEPELSEAIRKAKVIAHPDRGGNKKQFKMVVAAEETIRGGSRGA